jgi:anthranilate phosphoribosyltransferase
VAGLVDDLGTGIAQAREAIDSGAAVAALAALVEVSQRESAAEQALEPGQQG